MARRCTIARRPGRRGRSVARFRRRRDQTHLRDNLAEDSGGTWAALARASVEDGSCREPEPERSPLDSLWLDLRGGLDSGLAHPVLPAQLVRRLAALRPVRLGARDRGVEDRVVEHLRALGRRAMEPDAADLKAMRRLAAGPLRERWSTLVLLLMVRPLWIRSPWTWTPSGSSSRERVYSLVEHLLCDFPVPRFLLRPWLADEADLRWLAWTIVLGQGGSLRRLTQLARDRGCPGAWPLLPKKLPGFLWHVPAELPTALGIMFAEVLRLGGGAREFQRLRRDPTYVLDPTVANPGWREFWEGAVLWLRQHGERIDDFECRLILAWARWEFTGQMAAFRWSERGPTAALRLATAHNETLDDDRLYRWQRHDWDWQLEADRRRWRFVELLTSHELDAEGNAMSHCVGGYGWACTNGESAIFSLRRDGARWLTIDVNPETGELDELRGYDNRDPTEAEQALVERWLRTVVVPTRAPPQ